MRQTNITQTTQTTGDFWVVPCVINYLASPDRRQDSFVWIKIHYETATPGKRNPVAIPWRTSVIFFRVILVCSATEIERDPIHSRDGVSDARGSAIKADILSAPGGAGPPLMLPRCAPVWPRFDGPRALVEPGPRSIA